MSFAVMFPGQGSQHEGMRSAVRRHAPDLLETVMREIGSDPFTRLKDGTLYVQPAVFCASIASWRRARYECRPSAIAGHSLGELTALVAADVISEDDGLRLVLARARACESAAREVGGGMIALGVDVGTSYEIAVRCGAHLAADNSPRQSVLSGTEESLRSVELSAQRGGFRHLRLAIGGPFHSPLMGPALEPFAIQLEATEMRSPRCPIFTGVTAAPFVDLRKQLLDGLTKPVRWRELLLVLRHEGITRFVEAAPGKALCGLVRRTLPDACTEQIETGTITPHPLTTDGFH